jgi:hypothetical protein
LRDKKQKKGNLPEQEQRELEIRKLTIELNFLNSLKRVMDTTDGQVVIRWLLKRTNVFAKAFDNSGNTAFMLGEQNVGRLIVKKLTESGCNLNLTDFIDELDINKISNIHNQINQLEEEKKK